MSQSAPAKYAASRRVNGEPGVTRCLTEEQVWKGLGIKARQPGTFIDAILECEVLEDNGDKLVRSVRFKNEPDTRVREVVTFIGNSMVQFETQAPSAHIRITNELSYDGDDELMLTFTFTGGVPGTRPDQLPQNVNAVVGENVQHTIERLRELAMEGAI